MHRPQPILSAATQPARYLLCHHHQPETDGLQCPLPGRSRWPGSHAALLFAAVRVRLSRHPQPGGAVPCANPPCRWRLPVQASRPWSLSVIIAGDLADEDTRHPQHHRPTVFPTAGNFSSPDAALAHAAGCWRNRARISSTSARRLPIPTAQPVDAGRLEIARLARGGAGAEGQGRSRSPSTASPPPVQRWALAQGVDYLNDIHGFADAALYPELAQSDCQADRDAHGAGAAASPRGKMCRRKRSSTASWPSSTQGVTALTAAGMGRDRLILDPGMGFFLGTERQDLADRAGTPAGSCRPGLWPAAAGLGLAQGLPAQAGRPRRIEADRRRQPGRRAVCRRPRAPTISAPMPPGRCAMASRS